METIEVLLPVGYVKGDKVTDKIIRNLTMLYWSIELSTEIQGGFSKLIILNSFIPHKNLDSSLYNPNDVWYYMYDMDWGAHYYEINKPMQLITDKPYPGSRIIIPNGMMELSKGLVGKVNGESTKLCIMESFKLSRFPHYDKYLQGDLDIDVIGTTMNKNYKHTGNQVSSVPYNALGDKLKEYAFCLILHDYPHDRDNLPIKVAECLQSGVIPILVKEFGCYSFPTCDSIQDIKEIMAEYTLPIRKQQIKILADFHKNCVDFSKIARGAQLIETDAVFLEKVENILVWGREKHRGHYWRDNLDVKDFMKALQRHIDAYNRGELVDPETGESHLIHAACNLMFQHRIQYDKDNK